MGPWEITLTAFVISSTQAHSTERATHDTPQSSLHQHHITSPASPYSLPELQKKCVAKSDTFSSKSIAFCMEYPHRGTPYTAGGLDYVVKSHKGASIFSLIKPAIGVSRVVAGLGGRRQFQWMECIDHHR